MADERYNSQSADVTEEAPQLPAVTEQQTETAQAEQLDPRFMRVPTSNTSSDIAHARTDADHIKADLSANTQTAIENKTAIVWPYRDKNNNIYNVSDITEARLLLDYISEKCLRLGTSSISIQPSEYTELRGIGNTNRTATRKRLSQMLDIWKNAEINYKKYVKDAETGKSVLRTVTGRITAVYAAPEDGAKTDGQNKDLYIELTGDYINDVLHININKAPSIFLTGLFQIDIHHHPDAYYIGRKIIEQKNNSKGNTNENRLAVKTLLEEVRSRKSFDEIKKSWGKTNIRAKVREPFEADLNHFCDKTGIDYDFHYPNNGGVVPDDIKESCTFEEYSNFIIWFDWPKMPEEYERHKKTKTESRERKLTEKEINDKVDEYIIIQDKAKARRAERTRAEKKKENQ